MKKILIGSLIGLIAVEGTVLTIHHLHQKPNTEGEFENLMHPEFDTSDEDLESLSKQEDNAPKDYEQLSLFDLD